MIIASSAAVFVATVGAVALLRRLAHRYDLLDVPNQRSSHTAPTPRGGGLPVVIVVLITVAIVFLLSERGWARAFVLAFLLGGLAVATVSWLDDLKPVAARIRFAVHFLSALAFVASWFYFVDLDLPMVWLLAGGMVLVIWVVGLINAYNFMDGIDGLAGGQAIVSGCFWLSIGLSERSNELVMLSAVTVASVAGFLVHNWPPARIFLGDVGSGFFGFFFATLPLLFSHLPLAHTAVAVTTLWPFVFDTSFTLVRRFRQGQNIFTAHRSHLYQRLVIAGWSHRRVTLFYVMLSTIGGAIVMAAHRTGQPALSCALAALPLILLATVYTAERRRPVNA